MLDHDAALRQAVSDKQEAEAARNAKSKEIGKAKASGDEARFEQLRKEVAEAKDVIEAAGEQEAAARAELDKLLYGTPNIPMPDVPEGEDEAGNVEQHKWGTPNARVERAEWYSGPCRSRRWPEKRYRTAANGFRSGRGDERGTVRRAARQSLRSLNARYRPSCSTSKRSRMAMRK